ncbi:hypothetical protein HORIV_65770 [Vreelandella olivaria]|uniref:RNA polymerase-binding protein DksA n=1 Tax=Vreelandella olivaria TaxID=390919 RepID=A0ABM7GTR2_9GAMM|nr:hypothetical protein HORIV_65770 [Halomonas olivaria]
MGNQSMDRQHISNQSADEKSVSVGFQSESSEKAWEAKLLAMPASDYMNDEQLRFFRHRLLAERAEIETHLRDEGRHRLP